jgi:hypothetical protein
MKVLRQELEARGVTRADVVAVVDGPGLGLGAVQWPDGEKRPERPSL